MRALVVLMAAGCGSSNPANVPADHRLYDLGSETGDTKYIRYGGKQVDVADIPRVADTLGLPVSGTADIVIDVAIPKTRRRPDYAKAHGTISIACTKCRLGDDQAKLVLADLTGLAPDGIPFGHLTIDQLEVEATIAGGKLALTSFKLRSPDFEIRLALSMAFASSFEDSAVTGCIRFKPTAALRARDPRMHDMLSLTGAARGPDGFDHVSLEGTVGETRRLAKDC